MFLKQKGTHVVIPPVCMGFCGLSRNKPPNLFMTRLFRAGTYIFEWTGNMRVPSVLYGDVPRIGKGEMTDFRNPSPPCISTHVQGLISRAVSNRAGRNLSDREILWRGLLNIPPGVRQGVSLA